jgi:hypothetical protein
MNWMAQRIENKGALRVLYLLGPPRQAWQVTRNKQSQFHRGASSREDPLLGELRSIELGRAEHAAIELSFTERGSATASGCLLPNPFEGFDRRQASGGSWWRTHSLAES